MRQFLRPGFSSIEALQTPAWQDSSGSTAAIVDCTPRGTAHLQRIPARSTKASCEVTADRSSHDVSQDPLHQDGTWAFVACRSRLAMAGESVTTTTTTSISVRACYIHSACPDRHSQSLFYAALQSAPQHEGCIQAASRASVILYSPAAHIPQWTTPCAILYRQQATGRARQICQPVSDPVTVEAPHAGTLHSRWCKPARAVSPRSAENSHMEQA